jgi:transposase
MAIGRVVLAPSERRELERRARSRTLEAEDCKRAKLILLLAKGHSFSQVCRRLDCTDRYISVWKRRFKQGRLSGLDSRYRGSQRRVRTAETEAKILAATRKETGKNRGLHRPRIACLFHSWIPTRERAGKFRQKRLAGP